MPLSQLPEGTATLFAPAQRAPAQEVAGQARAWAGSPLLGDLLGHIPDLLMVLNRHRQVVFANRRLLELLEEDTPDDLLGKRPGEVLGCVHARDMASGCGTSEACRSCGAVLAIMASLQGRREQCDCRLTIDHPRLGRQSLDLQIWATPVQVSGEAYSFVAITDLGDQKRRRALERLFFHDILNTAGGLRGIAYLLTQAGQEDLPSLHESLLAASEQLLQEIQAQKDLLAAENNELRVSPQLTSAQEVLTQQVRLFSRHAVADQRRLLQEPAPADLVFQSDPTLLCRVLGNMLKNALEASNPGQEVRAGFAPAEEGLEFWVRNQAVMPREVQLQVFQRSFSTKGPGRGLGTYSMKLLTERYLQGRVDFTSGSLDGTTFRLWLPQAIKA